MELPFSLVGGLKNTKLRSLTYPQAISFLICTTMMTIGAEMRVLQHNVAGKKDKIV